MDLLTVLFAAYLETIAGDVGEHVVDVLGGEAKALSIEFDGYEIPFQYQEWTVRPVSVCASSRSNLDAYSACTLKAKTLFRSLCNELSGSDEAHWKFVKTRTMYCNAAVNFTPTIATIESAKELSPREQARADCNVAVARTMGDTSPSAVAARENACKAYNELK